MTSPYAGPKHSATYVTLRRMATKKSKPQSSTRKKTAAPRRGKKAAAKASKSIAKTKRNKKNDDEERLRKRMELTLRAFRMTYESNQRGTFRRIM